MNYMQKVLEMLGVEVGEKFKVDGLFDCPYYFNEYGVLINYKGKAVQARLLTILSGGYEVKKLPWKPELYEDYFCIIPNGEIEHPRWCDSLVDYLLFNSGNCFRTKKEITEEIKQRILREMKGKYEND